MTLISRVLNRKAIEFGENLMPNDCMDIMKQEYGNRINKLQPKSLYRIIYDMMMTATDRPYTAAIWDTVEDFMHS